MWMSVALGASQVEISPFLPVHLAGFAHRVGPAVKQHSPLYVKTFYFQQEDQVILLLIGDVIWWDGKMVRQWKERIRKDHGISCESICFHSTHTHSGPQTSEEFTHLLGLVDDRYIVSLEEKVLLSVREAIGNKEIVTGRKVRSVCELNVNRRKKVGNRVLMKPNRDDFADSELTTVVFENSKQDVKAMFVHYACHPTATDANVVSSEFPGQCCTVLSEHYKGAVIGFLQGCCGDLRPAFIMDDEFYRGSLQDMEKMGTELAGHVRKAVESGGKTLSLEGNFHAEVRMIPLLFRQDDEMEQVIKMSKDVLETWKAHKENVWRDIEFTELEMQVLHIGSDLHFIAFNGEMVQEYGLEAKRNDPDALPIGYSNGMVGYVPTSEQLNDGGYESEEFIYYFGLPAPFQQTIEKTIKNEMKKIQRVNNIGTANT